MEIFKLFGRIFVENTEANQALDTTDKKGKGIAGTLSSAIGTAGKWGAAMAAAGASAAIALGGLALKSATNFQKEMANVSTLLDGDVEPRIAELGETVKALSRETGTSTSLLTDGLYQVISAFGDSADSMKVLETAAKGAAAGNATVTDSVNLLSAVTKGYGDTSAEAVNKASDLAFLTVKLGQTTFPELASSMGKVIPLASSMKVSQEELFGAMATLTGVTGGTAEVTTQLRGTIQGFLQPTKEMSAALQQLGYDNGQTALEARGLGGILNDLMASVGGNEIAFSGLFGSIEAKNAVLALTGAQADNFTAKTEAMKGAVGATNDAFDRQQKSVSALMDRIKATGNTIAISLGERMLPILDKFLTWIMEHMPAIQETFSKVFGFIGGLIDGFITGVKIVIGWVRDWAEDNSETLEGIKAAFVEFFEAAGNLISGFIEFAINFWHRFGDEITAAVKFVWDRVAENIQKALELVSDVFNIFAAVFRGDWEEVWGGIKEFFTDIWDGIVDGLKGFINLIIRAMNGMIKGLNKLSWTAPSWVPVIGGKSWGIKVPLIPELAEGGDILEPGWVRVGEKGKPEDLFLPKGARVQPLPNPAGVDFKRLAADIGASVYDAIIDAFNADGGRELVLEMETERVARLLIPRIKSEKERLGVQEA